MGNCACVDREKNMEWDSEDWESLPTPKHRRLGNRIMDDTGGSRGGDVEKERLLVANEGFSSSSAATTTTSGSRDQVKLKITKKELEEMVRRDMEGLGTLEQFLASLINNEDDRCRTDHHRTWRPVLQSIPEVN
ncbi:DUF4228 domain-containing protein [Melia azedarach]|uniref:DUF4228 domain-containing protein n=2 Tax=Melia azedarach TaxID=155640 RepID=A0ACC1WZ48_MELAZ|nr:DUF4228 domain-containing protein [Melia azedarach]KAJ4703935.1 DUF4228 domain-containing protein [Melia azedarach]